MLRLENLIKKKKYIQNQEGDWNNPNQTLVVAFYINLNKKDSLVTFKFTIDGQKFEKSLSAIETNEEELIDLFMIFDKALTEFNLYNSKMRETIDIMLRFFENK